MSRLSNKMKNLTAENLGKLKNIYNELWKIRVWKFCENSC